MKTSTDTAAPTDPQPGNLSVRQLARSLSKTPATDQPTDQPPANNGTPEPDREPAPVVEDAPQPAPADLPNTEPQPETQPEPEAADPSAEPEPEPQPEAEPQPAKAELPEELRDAIELAKGDGKKGVAELLKRVHKLADDRDTQRNARLATEEQNAQLRKELQEARAAKPATNGSAGNGAHPAVAAISQELINVDHWLGWIEDNPAGGDIPDGKGGNLSLDAQQVKLLRRDLENQRSELVARKVQTQRDLENQFKTEYAKAHETAREAYPWMKNANLTGDRRGELY